MVHAPVQERPVMGYQNKALFPTQILAYQFPPTDVQMVCGFIDKQKIVFLGKQHRKLQLRLLSVA